MWTCKATDGGTEPAVTTRDDSPGDTPDRPLTSTVSQLAHALWNAERTARPVPDWQLLAGELSEADAYAVRREVDLLRMAAGAVPVGRRVSTAVAGDGRRRRYWCYLFAGRRRPGWPRVNCAQFIGPQVAAGIGLEPALDLAGAPAAGELQAAISALRPVLEILDARAADELPWPGTAIADSGRHALLIPGKRVEISAELWRQELTLGLRSNAAHSSLARVRLDTPEFAGDFVWLAEVAAAMGEPLQREELVVVGRPAPPQALLPGRTYWSELAGVGPDLCIAGVYTDLRQQPGRPAGSC